MLAEGFLLNGFHRLREGFLDLLYPRDCLHCGQVISDNGPLRYLCSACFLDVEVFRPPCCQVCGFPFYGMVTGPRTCPHCIELKPKFGRGRTAFHLGGPMRELVHTLKYQNGFFALEDLVSIALMAPGVREFLEGAVLVPVPLHPWRQFRRSYNQTRLIAEKLVPEVRDVRMEDLLRRVRWTGSQTRLSREKRRLNMRGAFALRKGRVVNASVRYVVLDDVFTTGSTLNACCETLRRAGAVNLDILALGHG